MRFEAFVIDEIKQEDGNVFLKGITAEGKQREFGLQVVRDKVSNGLRLLVFRHFSDPDSVPAFEGSEPWTEDETRGTTNY